MTLPDLPGRRYDDEEVGALLKRATELQRRDPSAVGSAGTGGLSLEELAEIAAEAGIDPSFLRRAAAEMESTPMDETLGAQLAGENLSLVSETVIPGELTNEGFERVLIVVQRRTSELGQPSFMGRTLTWQAESPSKTRLLQVVVTVREGQTHIRAEERLHQLASGLFGGVIGGVGGGLGIAVGVAVGLEVLGSALFAVAFPAGLIGLSFVGARQIYKGLVRKRRRILGDLVEEIAREVAGAVVLQPRVPRASEGGGRLGAGAAEGAGEGEPSEDRGPLGGEEPPRLLP